MKLSVCVCVCVFICTLWWVFVGWGRGFLMGCDRRRGWTGRAATLKSVNWWSEFCLKPFIDDMVRIFFGLGSCGYLRALLRGEHKPLVGVALLHTVILEGVLSRIVSFPRSLYFKINSWKQVCAGAHEGPPHMFNVCPPCLGTAHKQQQRCYNTKHCLPTRPRFVRSEPSVHWHSHEAYLRSPNHWLTSATASNCIPLAT